MKPYLFFSWIYDYTRSRLSKENVLPTTILSVKVIHPIDFESNDMEPTDNYHNNFAAEEPIQKEHVNSNNRRSNITLKTNGQKAKKQEFKLIMWSYSF